MARLKGTVEFFDPKKRFGKINPDGGGELVFVHCSAITTQREFALAAGEPVEFDLEKGERGPIAKNVRRFETRWSGKVDYFDRKRGTGSIQPDAGDGEIFVHYSDIISQKDYKSLEAGEQVDYTLVESEGRRKALRVVPDTRMPLERFAFLASFDRKLQSLATMAPEDWAYRYTASPHALPVLNSFIHYTFQRVQEENKITYAEDATQGGKPTRIACFNTGLTTEYFDPIFAAFSENNSEDGDELFFLRGFFTESQHPLTCFTRRPDPANYFSDPADLIYDRRLSLVRNVEHIVERIERFPAHYRDNPRRLVNAVDIAISRAEQRVIRNYKTAIPQYNRGRIQLLLPLCLDDPAVADVALVIGKEGAVYKGYTVLTLDMAYNNARLLTRPDREWLVP